MHDTSSQAMLNVKQGDSARKIYFSLTDGGRPYKISAGCTAVFRAKKPDGSAILYNDCSIVDNVIEYTLTNETCKNIGIVECEVTLYGANKRQITSPRFSLIVEGTLVDDEEIEATNEFTALVKALAEIDNLDASVSKVGDTATITITKKNGATETVTLKDGANGKDAIVTELASAIVGTAKGTTLFIPDSANTNFRKLNIYGRSTQDGTPTPTAPIDIASVGDDGKIKCDVCGKNLIEPLMENSTRNGITVTNNGDGSFTVNGTAEGTAAFRLNQSTMNGLDNLKPYKGKYCLSLRDSAGNKNPQGLMLFLVQASDWKNYLGSATKPTADIDVSGSFVYLHIEDGGTFSNFVVYPQLEVGSSMTNWEKPIINPLEIILNTPLRAIPVTDPSIATYTDANGQMWYADELDLNRGVYIQRCYAETVAMSFQEANNRYVGTTSKKAYVKLGTVNGVYLFCKELPFNGDVGLPNSQTNGVRISTSAATTLVANYNGQSIDTLDIVFPLATPIETPLTAEEIAAYRLLKTNYPNTTITNDENAYMSAEYVIDTKTYIDKIISTSVGASGRVSSVTLKASKWVGDSSLYSQVVAIDGTTENSKVDLNPTVEQLSIFHNKDIAFVTENDGGIITVFCLGQKPTNDYTMQVTITEVTVNG